MISNVLFWNLIFKQIYIYKEFETLTKNVEFCETL